MDLTCEERSSDSPFVEKVWRSNSEGGGAFTSIANPLCGIVVTRINGQSYLTVRGPETMPTPAFAPPDADFFGIIFKPGVSLRLFPPSMVMDRRDVNLPDASSKKFWLNGSSWQLPDFESADTFVDWLERDGVLTYDPLVSRIVDGYPVRDVTQRTAQRRFLQATGMTCGTMYQIERARRAVVMLKRGMSILDTVEQTGYSDQPHLTRALKHYIGLTPTQIYADSGRAPLSLLFKSPPF